MRLFSGNWGVTLFFVISGFLITTLLLSEFERFGRIDIRAFYLRRAIRILPPAYFFLFSVLVLNQFEVIEVAPLSLLSALLFLKNLPIPGVPHDWYLGHFWSLAVEEQYYLILPILLIIVRKQLSFVCIAFIFCSLLVTFIYFHIHKNSFSLRMMMAFVVHLVPLLVGTLFAILNTRYPLLKRKISSLIIVLCAILSMLSLSSAHNYIPSLVKPLFAATFAGIVILGAINTANGVLGWLLNNAASDFMGRISYSLYLWQQLFTNQSILNIDALAHYAIPLNILAILAFALGSYYLIEKPLFGIRGRLRHR